MSNLVRDDIRLGKITGRAETRLEVAKKREKEYAGRLRPRQSRQTNLRNWAGKRFWPENCMNRSGQGDSTRANGPIDGFGHNDDVLRAFAECSRC